MDKEYIEEITIANMATNFPDIDVSVVRDYMTGRTPEIECKECKFKAAPLGNSTCCNKRKRIVYASGCNYGEPKPITNGDRIRAMSDEELAEYFPTHASLCPDLEENKTMCKGANFMADDKMCRQCWLDWLRQEAQP